VSHRDGSGSERLLAKMRDQCCYPTADEVMVDVMSSGEMRLIGVCGRRVPTEPEGWVVIGPAAGGDGSALCPEHAAEFEGEDGG
jgi:hypothetical protein